MILGLLASLLAPAIVLLGMGICAVARRRHGEWHVYTPQQNGPAKAAARAMLLKRWTR